MSNDTGRHRGDRPPAEAGTPPGEGGATRPTLRELGPWMGFAVLVVRPLSIAFTKRLWRGQENVPRTGGVIIAANHLSWVDPFVLAHFVYDAGRIPRFMAKESLFRAPVTGWVLRGAHQIPVFRGERDGAAALRDAVAALQRGEAVLIYPEGTITRDPDYWPMQAKTGVARLALMSGAPVVPVAQWGPQEILGKPRRLRLLPRLLPRRTVQIVAGAPIVPASWGGAPVAATAQPGRAALRALTSEVMTRIRTELETLRDEPAPAGTWDPRQGERVLAHPTEGAA